MPGLDDIEKAVADHDDQGDAGLDKAGDAAKDEIDGHDGQIDAAVKKSQGLTGDSGDS